MVIHQDQFSAARIWSVATAYDRFLSNGHLSSDLPVKIYHFWSLSHAPSPLEPTYPKREFRYRCPIIIHADSRIPRHGESFMKIPEFLVFVERSENSGEFLWKSVERSRANSDLRWNFSILSKISPYIFCILLIYENHCSLAVSNNFKNSYILYIS